MLLLLLLLLGLASCGCLPNGLASIHSQFTSQQVQQSKRAIKLAWGSFRRALAWPMKHNHLLLSHMDK